MLIKHHEISREIDMVDEMIAYERSWFTPHVDRYSGSNLEALEQYRSYLVSEMNKGHDAQRPAEIKDEIKRQILEQESLIK